MRGGCGGSETLSRGGGSSHCLFKSESARVLRASTSTFAYVPGKDSPLRALRQWQCRGNWGREWQHKRETFRTHIGRLQEINCSVHTTGCYSKVKNIYTHTHIHASFSEAQWVEEKTLPIKPTIYLLCFKPYKQYHLCLCMQVYLCVCVSTYTHVLHIMTEKHSQEGNQPTHPVRDEGPWEG